MIPYILLGKVFARISQMLKMGNGSTWPGHIALFFNKNFIHDIQKKSDIRIILVIGTNGKTTTGKLLATILEKNGKTVLQNASGANLLNGIASALVLHADWMGKIAADFAIFEIDENTLLHIVKQIKPFAIIALNLFRDQLDRYGELDSIVQKWKKALAHISTDTILVLNADDPQIAYLGTEITAKTCYFGLDSQGTKKEQYAADTLYCPNCNNKLNFSKVYYSHIGVWSCTVCPFKHPQPTLTTYLFPLAGMYNKYNTLAAVLLAKQIGIQDRNIKQALQTATPAFGRQEKIEKDGKFVQIFLAKNPTSFNQSLQTIFEMKAKYLLVLLNDRIPDGRDVSWIWDIDIEEYIKNYSRIFISGDRVYDMALRIQYGNCDMKRVSFFEDLDTAIHASINAVPKGETLYVLPTYSAMLELRKILLGRRIL